jgi:2-amino-4-hydroxy-6-hydroxymethyldihydropteridine diphosphokinase
VRAVVGVGANLGDREAAVRGAFALLRTLPGVIAFEASPLYETAPVGGPPQPPFINAAALLVLTPARSPASIVSALLAIEHEMGRVRGERNGPRTIDLDLLWTDGTPSRRADATVPHPRLAERAFALVPLLDLVPDACAEDGTPYREIADKLDRAQVVRVAGP